MNLMTAEQRASGAPPNMEGGYRPPLLHPASEVHIPFLEQPLERQRFDLPLQQEVAEKMIHLFGPNYTPTIAVDSFLERGQRLEAEIRRTPPAELNGRLTDAQYQELADRSACLRISAAVLATKLGLNLGAHIDRKLMLRMQYKYPPHFVTEVRFWGTPDNPGKMRGAEALAALKKTYDSEAEVQMYQFRDLEIPENESDHTRRINDFSGYQMIAALWQDSALGSDLVPSERVENIIGEDGEVQEVMAEFEGMSPERIDELARNDTKDLPKLEAIGDELADVFIGTYCGDSALGIDSNAQDAKRVRLAIKKYGNAPRIMRRLGHDSYDVRWVLDSLDDDHRRRAKGLQPSTRLARVVYRSK